MAAHRRLRFPTVEPFAAIAVVAFLGTINPSTGDIGVLVPLEHAMLAQGVPPTERTQHVRALQPDRRAGDGRRLARRRRARPARRLPASTRSPPSRSCSTPMRRSG